MYISDLAELAHAIDSARAELTAMLQQCCNDRPGRHWQTLVRRAIREEREREKGPTPPTSKTSKGWRSKSFVVLVKFMEASQKRHRRACAFFLHINIILILLIIITVSSSSIITISISIPIIIIISIVIIIIIINVLVSITGFRCRLAQRIIEGSHCFLELATDPKRW